jgi:TPR repeat protein
MQLHPSSSIAPWVFKHILTFEYLQKNARNTLRNKPKMTKKAILIAFSLMLSPLSGLAQNFDAGGAAFNNGDYITALHEWVPLAEEGNDVAQLGVGFMYRDGLGVVQDYAEAVRWYRLAADQGNVYAQYDLGVMYRDGLGIVQDYAEAARSIDN